MEDLTGEVARMLGVDVRVLAVVLGAPWRRADGGTGPAGPAPDGPPVHGRVFVGVPSPAELRELDLPADGLRHFGLTPAQLRAGGWTDADLRAAGLPVPGAGDAGGVEWFVAGEPAQLMLGIGGTGPPRLARPEPRPNAPGHEPADAEAVPQLTGCTDPEDADGSHVRAVRDRLLRTARRRLVHCTFCLRSVHRSATTYGACPGCAARWLGVVH